MKNISIALIIVVISACSYGQDNGERGHDNGVSIRLNQIARLNIGITDITGSPDDTYDFKANYLSADLVGFFGIKENTSFRVRIGYTRLSFNSDMEYNYSYSSSYSSNKVNLDQSTVTFSPGIVKNIPNDKLVLFVGVELPVDVIGKLEIKTEDEYASPGYSSLSETETTWDGGMSFGLKSLIGFRYALVGPLAVGTEFNYGFRYLSSKGEIETDYYSNGAQTSSYEQDVSITGFGMSPLTASLVLTVQF